MISGIVGDDAILWTEKRYYGVSGWLSERTYATKLGLGVEKPHQLIVPAAPESPTEPEPRTIASDSGDGGESRWEDKGCYLLTFVYPEPKLDSIADMVFFKPGKTRLHMVCGTVDPYPGGTGTIPSSDRESVVMAFTGGFKYRHDHGGMALDGRMLRPMKNGLGTVAVFKDGTVKVGKWGRDWVKVSPLMRDVRQGFMLIDRGKYCDNPLFNIYSQDKKSYVRRSAIGVTSQGAVVYATGNNLSAGGLARAMMAAGVVSAVHLEMNLSRVLCGVFHNDGGGVTVEPLTSRCCDPSSLAGKRERDFMYVTSEE